MNLKIKPSNDSIFKLYEGHGHFHKGDAGIDLFIIEKQTIKSGETVKINFGISCETNENIPYFLMPRSSISKSSIIGLPKYLALTPFLLNPLEVN